MSEKREKTDIELSWESGKFEEDLHKLDHQLTKEIWAHDRCQASFQREDLTWKVSLVGMSVLFGILVAVSEKFFPDYTNMLTKVCLTTIIPAIMGMYAWRDPAGKRSAHILVSGQKSDTQGKINLQLIQKPKYRELADTFYRWIHSEYSRVGGTSGAEIPTAILDQYRDDSKKNN